MSLVIKLAFDTQISKKTAHEMRMAGYDIVYHAKNEPDDVWIENALTKGATIFVSPDLDIPNYLDRMDVSAAWIDVPQGMSGDMQFSHIARQILRLLKNKVASQASYKIINLGKYQYLVEHNYIDRFLSATSEDQRMRYCQWRIKGSSINVGGTANVGQGEAE